MAEPSNRAGTRSPTTAGYSGTPLSKKLGIKEGSCLLLLSAPKDYFQLLEPLPDGVTFQSRAGRRIDIAQIFVTRREALRGHLAQLRKALSKDAAVWVSWPKKAAKVATDVTEDTIREVALPMGFVDIKVCAVSEVWSGLKLVVRKELR
jgi:Protein of unknown function (DUF3052)